MNSHDTPEKSYDLERLIFFSDGVFAIAITLLVIELHPPENWDHSFSGLMEHVAAHLVYYFISFAALGAFWMMHRFIFRHVRVFRETASWINLLFLATVCLIPFGNMLLGAGDITMNVIWIYIGLMSAASLVGGFLWSYLSLITAATDPRLTTGFKLIMLLRIAILPPVMCAASLWVGMLYGMLPSGLFAAAIIFLSTLIKSKPYKDPAITADDAG
jgi:uncharacterized membrane protein